MSSIINYKDRFEGAKKSFESKGYKPIHIFLFDPAHSIFKEDKNRREYIKVIWCNQCEKCEAYKNGKCFMLNSYTIKKCPFAKTYYEEGFTRRSKSYYSFLSAAENVFNISDFKISSRLSSLDHTCSIGDGSYIHLRLHHLQNYVNPIAYELGMEEKYFIPASNFTPETVKKLLNYRPQALMGGEIKSYIKEDLPQFIRDLKLYFPDLYNSAVDGTGYGSLIEQISYEGRKAYVKTLLPGKVKLSFNVWDWNGEKMTIRGSNFSACLNDNELIELTPTDLTVVEVLDNTTVSPLETKFKNI